MDAMEVADPKVDDPAPEREAGVAGVAGYIDRWPQFSKRRIR